MHMSLFFCFITLHCSNECSTNYKGKEEISWIVKKGANQYRELNFDTSQGGVGGA